MQSAEAVLGVLRERGSKGLPLNASFVRNPAGWSYTRSATWQASKSKQAHRRGRCS
jgi:hypothetical protein